MALLHGETQVIVTGYVNKTFTKCRKFFCAKCDFWVSEWQWREQHKAHTGDHSSAGVGLALPDETKPKFFTRAAGGK